MASLWYDMLARTTWPGWLIATALLIALAPALSRAETALNDPNLPHASPEALKQLSESRIRQRIMQESQTPYRGRCVCPYQTRDAKGHSCKGRHEIVKTLPQPICYPQQVTRAMISKWKQRQASQ